MARSTRFVVLTGALVVLVLAAFFSVTVIPVGHVGVVTFLGSTYDEPLYPGMSMINPLASITMYDTRTQVHHFDGTVPTQEGVNIQLEASCLIHVDQTQVVRLFRTVPFKFQPVILIPQFESAIREVTTAHTAAALYTSAARQTMTSMLKKELASSISKHGLVVESTPINKLELPAIITDAIKRKLQLQQEAESMQYVLQKEQQEAERKEIEAQGIAQYQKIIANSTSEAILRWNAIQTTEILGKSCNARMLLFGRSGLPMVDPQTSPRNNSR